MTVQWLKGRNIVAFVEPTGEIVICEWHADANHLDEIQRFDGGTTDATCNWAAGWKDGKKTVLTAANAELLGEPPGLDLETPMEFVECKLFYGK